MTRSEMRARKKEILEALASGETQVSVAKRFNMKQPNISRLAKGSKRPKDRPKARPKSRPRSPAWPIDLEYKLRDMWDAGVSTAEIGRRLGFTKNAIVGKSRRLELERRPDPICRKPFTDADKEEVAAMLRNGTSVRNIKKVKHIDHLRIATIISEKRLHDDPTSTLPELSYMPVHSPDQLTLSLDSVVVPFTGPTQRRCKMPMWGNGERTRFVNGEPDFCGKSVSRGPYCAECGVRAYGRRLVAEAVA